MVEQHPGFTLSWPLESDHPTIAEQLAADLLLWKEPPGIRKALRERLLAAQITSRFGRTQLLGMVPEQRQLWTKRLWSRCSCAVYFQKPAGKLSLPEFIWLSALLDAPRPPSGSGPFSNVVNKSFAQGMLSATQATAAVNSQVNPSVPDKSSTDLAPAFSAAARDSLAGEDPHSAQAWGLKIITTLDYDLQQQATCALAEQLKRLGTHSSQPGFPASLDCGSSQITGRPFQRATSLAANSLAANAVILSPKSGKILAFVGDPNHSLIQFSSEATSRNAVNPTHPFNFIHAWNEPGNPRLGYPRAKTNPQNQFCRSAAHGRCACAQPWQTIMSFLPLNCSRAWD